MGTLEEDRKEAVRRYLSGESVTSISRNIERSRTWLYKWLDRYNQRMATGIRTVPVLLIIFPTKLPTEWKNLY